MDTSTIKLVQSQDNSHPATFTIASMVADELRIPARTCMRFVDAELHPVIGRGIAALQNALKEADIEDNGATAVATLLYFEKRHAVTAVWTALIQTLAPMEGYPANWDAGTTDLLNLAQLDMQWFSLQRQSMKLRSQLIHSHVLSQLPLEYGHKAEEANSSAFVADVAWALTLVQRAGMLPAFVGDAVALCPLLHAIPRSNNGTVVQHEFGVVSNFAGETRKIVKFYLLPASGATTGIKIDDSNSPCGHAIFYQFGHLPSATDSCVPIKITVPGIKSGSTAISVLRRSAMQAGGLIKVESHQTQVNLFYLQPRLPFPRDLMRLLRLSLLQFTDVE
jgi:hypothetical protein